MMHDVRGERQRLLVAIEAEMAAGRRFAVATVVGTTGSTYRHAGARLLVTEDGDWVGNISGGCLEGEVLDVGARVIQSGRAALAHYDLTADEEAVWGWGLGCNGAIDVLVEPGETAVQVLQSLTAAEGTSRPQVLATVIASSVATAGGHLLVLEDGTTTGDVPAELRTAVAAAARSALSDGTTRRVDIDGSDVFLEVVRPPLHLVVFGAGHDAVPLVRVASGMGWSVTVADDRSAFLTPERFPGASGLVRSEPLRAATEAGIDDHSYAVVMSHNFLRDVDYLAGLLGSACSYIGMLGPARRLQRILDHLESRGVTAEPDDRLRLYGPAGLDLGAEGPDEIALSICAEILAVSRDRAGGSLRTRKGVPGPPVKGVPGPPVHA